MLKKTLIRLVAKALIYIRTWWEKNECAGASAYDIPDIRDYSAPEINPPKAKMPVNFSLLKKMIKYKWKADKQKDSECTAFSKIYQAEGVNSIWNDKLVKLDPWRQWHNQEQTGAKQGQGDSIQNSQEQYRKDPQGYPIYKYFRLMYSGDELIRQMKLWIYSHYCPIQTGVKWRRFANGKDNYYNTKKTGVYEPFVGGKVIGAHAVVITGWKGNFWEIKESLLNQWEEHTELGVFYVHMDNTRHLFSKYVVKDARDD